MYAGCPIVWKSQLQTEIALSSTESEYMGLSYALQEAIHMMEILKEMKHYGFPVTEPNTDVHCRVFEDNSGAIDMARVHKFRPQTKHVNIKLHHFRSYVEKGEVSIQVIKTTQQIADYLTKPLNAEQLCKQRETVMGW